MTIYDEKSLSLLPRDVLLKIRALSATQPKGDEEATITKAPRSMAPTTVGPWS